MKKLMAMLTVLGCLQWDQAHPAPFQNLDFESPILPLEPVNPPPDQHVLLSRALPGWQGFVGTNPVTLVNYDDVSLTAAGISIWDRGVIEGRFSVLLQSGLYREDPTQILPACLSQVGDVPADAPLLQLKARASGRGGLPGLWSVTLGGQPIPMTPVGAGSDYTLYSGDILAFSGQTVELRICTLFNEPYGEYWGDTALKLDSITFVPEPGRFALLAVGLAVCALAWRRRALGSS